MTKALIAGGGISGAVTAMALRKAGIEAVVYEAYPHGGADVGAFLTIMHNGMDALRAVDLHETVIAHSFPANGIEFFSPAGEKLSERYYHQAGMVSPRTLTRSELYTALHAEATRRGIAIEHGKRLVTAAPSPGGVTARFEDGTSAEADVLIGADGIHSVVRNLIDPGAARPRFTGLNIVYGYTSDPDIPTALKLYKMTQGSRAFFGCTTSPAGLTFWFSRIAGPERGREELAAVTPAQWREFAAEAFEGDPIPAARIIRATGDEVYGGLAYDVPTTRVWSTPEMVLVGDAAHAASPAAGQGASMALEDSVILAQCLRDFPDAATAFDVYEGLRRERVERLVDISARQIYGDLDRAWLYNHHIEWASPVTSA